MRFLYLLTPLCLSMLAAEPLDYEPLVQRLSRLVQVKDVPTEAMFSANALATNFSKTERVDPARLAGRFGDCQTLFLQTYSQCPTTLATDISNAIEADKNLPASVREALVVPPAQGPRANQCANAWVAELLNPQKNEQVGVIVLVERQGDETPTLRLVLAKGTQLRDGSMRISQVVYGSSGEAVK